MGITVPAEVTAHGSEMNHLSRDEMIPLISLPPDTSNAYIQIYAIFKRTQCISKIKKKRKKKSEKKQKQ